MRCSSKYDNLDGREFGRLKVRRIDGGQESRPSSQRVWICDCECGDTAFVTASNLVHGNSKSCGCTGREWRHSAKNAARWADTGQYRAERNLQEYGHRYGW